MFERLQQKWKVKGGQLALILITFAVGGSLTGYAARQLMPVFAIGPAWLWIVVYILLVTLLWPIAVLLISIPFGQFPFFIKYIKKIGARIGLGKRQESGVRSSHNREPLQIHIAIFASGAGSNAQKIIDHFRDHEKIRIGLIVCNNPSAGVLSIASREGIPTLVISKEQFFRGDAYIKELNENKIDFIVLAGFLLKIPVALIKAYPGKIINIHPALLPRYGGKGMYGRAVHQAVIDAKEKKSGITIHYVDELYDHGKIIFQAHYDLGADETPQSLAEQIHKLEHEHYPRVIEKLLKA